MVKELSVSASVDRALRGRVALKPYALAAFELDTQPGIGQLDGGFKAGRYLELGAAPGYSVHRVGIAVPVKVGLSLGNYTSSPVKIIALARQHRRRRHAAAHSQRDCRSWNVHGGVEYQWLGTTTKAFNAGEPSKTIASIGIGFSR
jgi:hypothetical protein